MTGTKYVRHNIMGSLKIKKFQLSQIKDNSVIVMIAKRNSGKSWVVRALLHHFRKIPVGVVISPTDEMTSFYGKFLPDTFVYYKYESDILDSLVTRQSKIIKNNKKRIDEGKDPVDPRAFLVMDDCMADDREWKKDPRIMDILANGRHRQLMFVLTMQYALGLTPKQRTNVDYVFLLKDDTIQNQKKKNI